MTNLRRLAHRTSLSDWELWHLPGSLRAYIFAVHAAAIAALVALVLSSHWHARDVAVFIALLLCGAVTIEATRRISVPHSAVSHDMLTVWYIVAVALLPPFYAFCVPPALAPYRMLRMAPGILYRRVVSGSICALAYGAAATVFSHLPGSFAGTALGGGPHVVTWLVSLGCCGVLGVVVNNALIIFAIKLSDPAARMSQLAFNGEAVVSDLCQLSLATLIALPAAFNLFLLVGALPVVAVMRRFMMHAQLVTASRIDAKTGLLNAATWQREAELEVSRAMRINSPIAIAIADIDHFKAVNDKHGHLAGDGVLALMAATMSALVRDYDLLGRFGGEEFIICLPHTGPAEALQIAERLREKVSLISAEGPGSSEVQVTISVGVASLEASRRSLDELIAAADAVLYQAKAAGRNCVRISYDEFAQRNAS